MYSLSRPDGYSDGAQYPPPRSYARELLSAQISRFDGVTRVCATRSRNVRNRVGNEEVRRQRERERESEFERGEVDGEYNIVDCRVCRVNCG